MAYGHYISAILVFASCVIVFLYAAFIYDGFQVLLYGFLTPLVPGVLVFALIYGGIFVENVIFQYVSSLLFCGIQIAVSVLAVLHRFYWTLEFSLYSLALCFYIRASGINDEEIRQYTNEEERARKVIIDRVNRMIMVIMFNFLGSYSVNIINLSSKRIDHTKIYQLNDKNYHVLLLPFVLGHIPLCWGVTWDMRLKIFFEYYGNLVGDFFTGIRNACKGSFLIHVRDACNAAFGFVPDAFAAEQMDAAGNIEMISV